MISAKTGLFCFYLLCIFFIVKAPSWRYVSSPCCFCCSPAPHPVQVYLCVIWAQRHDLSRGQLPHLLIFINPRNASTPVFHPVFSRSTMSASVFGPGHVSPMNFHPLRSTVTSTFCTSALGSPSKPVSRLVYQLTLCKPLRCHMTFCPDHHLLCSTSQSPAWTLIDHRLLPAPNSMSASSIPPLAECFLS